MIKKTVTYTDYNGVERTEDFYFNLNEAEALKLEMGVTGGLSAMVQRVIAAKDNTTLINIFEELVLKAYGVKGPDGREFIKNDEVRAKFTQTEAYSIIFMELATNAEKAAEFVNGIVPKKKEQGATPVPIAN